MNNYTTDDRPLLTEVPRSEGQSSNKKISISQTQWGIIGGNKYYPTTETVNNIPSGYYSIKWIDGIGPSLEHKNVLSEKLLHFPDSVVDKILIDIKNFWTKKESYKKYELVYKRGILLYGYPGNGKTSIIELLSDILIKEYGGIVIKINRGNELEYLYDLIPAIINLERDRKLIIVFEDVDGLVVDEGYERMLINFLDGAYKIDNVVNIATTNYPEKLKERITNRPSRFDRRYEINLPSSEVRKFYIENMTKEDDLENIDINQWVKDTEGYTIDHLKELITSVFVLGYEYDESITTINNIKNNGAIKSTYRSDGHKTIKGLR